MKSEPFDRLFLERTAKGTVVSCSIGWSDVGSWQALWHVSKKDGQGNVTHGPAIVQNAVNCYVRSDGPAVAILGARDITVIATKDAVLVAPRAHAQDIRDLVSAVEIHTPGMAQEHTVARRPWGTYESVARGDKFQVKHIVVLPGRSLSLQSHKHRAEHWVVVSGTAKVECDGVEKLVHPNQSVFIPLGAKHRLGNPGKADLHLIEVQSGNYLGEDDIVRYADNYGRAN
jgi:mannose-1-phosphate guanylyltransferase/mannose-6-phosphate isomerase